jgi:mannose-6-phosphate isomerase-like protein (cupin superfamily)
MVRIAPESVSGPSSPTVDRMAEAARTTPNGYHEFLRVPSLSAGVYVIAPGAVDRQAPHTEDEVYHVVRGRARFRLGDEEFPVGPGDVLFVAARVTHRFLAVEKELVLLVVFAPAEARGSRATPPSASAASERRSARNRPA